MSVLVISNLNLGPFFQSRNVEPFIVIRNLNWQHTKTLYPKFAIWHRNVCISIFCTEAKFLSYWNKYLAQRYFSVQQRPLHKNLMPTCGWVFLNDLPRLSCSWLNTSLQPSLPVGTVGEKAQCDLHPVELSPLVQFTQLSNSRFTLSSVLRVGG